MGRRNNRLGCDFDRHELVNQHRTVREFLGHGAFSQGDTYELQTIIDNVYLLTPELLSEIGRLVVESGHARKKKAWRAVARALVIRLVRDRRALPDRSTCCGTRCVLAPGVGPCGEEAQNQHAGASGDISPKK